MSPIDVVIAVAAVAVVVGVTVWALVRKKQGKSVGCDCASACNGKCDGCHACHKKEEK